MKNKKMVIALVAFVLVLLLTITSTYAYFTASERGIGSQQQLNMKTGTLSITYEGLDSISNDNVLPGWNDTISLRVTNTGTLPVTFDLVWTNVVNVFKDNKDLVYDITCTGGCTGLAESVFPEHGNDIPILQDIVIPSETTYTYTATVKFLNTNDIQNDNLGKTLQARLIIKTNNDQYAYTEPTTQQYVNNTLGKAILDNNPLHSESPTFQKSAVSLTTYNSLPNVSNGTTLGKQDAIVENGLYKVFGNDNKYTYVFRGEVDNYVSFANKIWRIIRINEDGTIRMVSNTDEVISEYSYVISSDLTSWYTTNLNSYDSFISSVKYCNDNLMYDYMKSEEDLMYFLLNDRGYDNSVNSFINEMNGLYSMLIEDGIAIPSNYIIQPRESFDSDYHYILYLLRIEYGLSYDEDFFFQNILISEEAYLEYISDEISYFNGISSNSYYRFKTNNPSYVCNNYNEVTLSKISYPTIDDIMYAGIDGNHINTNSYYNINSVLYGEMIKNRRDGMYLSLNNGVFNENGISPDSYPYAPVISLNANVLISGGNGSSASPYIVNTN